MLFWVSRGLSSTGCSHTLCMVCALAFVSAVGDGADDSSRGTRSLLGGRPCPPQVVPVCRCSSRAGNAAVCGGTSFAFPRKNALLGWGCLCSPSTLGHRSGRLQQPPLPSPVGLMKRSRESSPLYTREIRASGWERRGGEEDEEEDEGSPGLWTLPWGQRVSERWGCHCLSSGAELSSGAAPPQPWRG